MVVNSEVLEKIKRLTIAALVSDEYLMGVLVLKGGNALNLAYDISSRGSLDIDFSIELDISEHEKSRLISDLGTILNDEFRKENLEVFDVKFQEKPGKIDDAVRDFWGGYKLEFKIATIQKLAEANGDLGFLRRNALIFGPGQSPKFEVEISKYEYVARKSAKDIEGAVVYVYTPEMLALEKLRALCQQIPDYRNIVIRMTSKSRARDFFDIHTLCSSFNMDFNTPENIELARLIFEAKRVPLSFIGRLSEIKEMHRDSWEVVLSTIDRGTKPLSFDYYADFVTEKFKHLAQIPLG